MGYKMMSIVGETNSKKDDLANRKSRKLIQIQRSTVNIAILR